MAFATDPFTQVHNALWALLIANTLFASKVKAANRIRFDSTETEPIRAAATSEDQPWVTIVQSGGSEKDDARTFAARMINQSYEVQVWTGNQRVHKELNPIKWAVVKAVLGALGALTTTDAGFVKNVRIAGAWQDRLEPGTEAQASRGWVHVLTVEVWMDFTIVQLQAVDS